VDKGLKPPLEHKGLPCQTISEFFIPAPFLNSLLTYLLTTLSREKEKKQKDKKTENYQIVEKVQSK
jgi:hypothetical protein